jgi:hypothetical protein
VGGPVELQHCRGGKQNNRETSCACLLGINDNKVRMMKHWFVDVLTSIQLAR